jgi:uncharacterized protein with HEPN domain
MSREINKLLTDIDMSIALIESYLLNVPNYEAFELDILTMDGVQRRLSIIGEALWKADKLDQALPITDKKKIISFRHILIHNYDLLSDATIWKVCTEHLPVLKIEVRTLLNAK